MNAPLISIIIPSYNSAGTIRQCLGRIAEQTFRNYEVIICDGGSTDSTAEIVREFDGKISGMQWHSEKDNGTYDAINKGITKAKGDWIYVIGTDDQLHEATTLEKIAPVIAASQHCIVYGNVKVVGNAGWAKDGTIHDGPFDITKLLQRNICQQAVFYPKEIFKELGNFNTRFKVCADWDFILHAASKYELKYTNHIIADFHGGGASGTGENQLFYDELAGNLFSYFGWRVLRREFRPAAWRFARLAEQERNKGNRLKGWLFRKLSERK